MNHMNHGYTERSLLYDEASVELNLIERWQYNCFEPSLFFFNTKTSSLFLWLNKPVVSNLLGNPKDRFSCVAAQMVT